MHDIGNLQPQLKVPPAPREGSHLLLRRRVGISNALFASGRYLVALPFLIYPYFHFKYGPGVATIVPPWMPFPLFWAYFTGASMLAAGLAIAFKKYSRTAAILLGTEIFLFVLMIHVFLIFHRPGDPWAEGGLFSHLDLPGRLNNAFKDLGLSGAIFIVAGNDRTLRKGRDIVLILGRGILAFAIAAFGVLHFVYPDFAPGIPPMYTAVSFILPGHAFWVYSSAVLFLVCAVCIAASYRVRNSAAILGCTIFLFAWLTWVPRFPSHPSEVTDNWLKDLGVAGGALVLAAASREEESPPGEKQEH